MKKDMDIPLKPRCTLCGSPWHYKTFCLLNTKKAIAKRKPIQRVGKQTKKWLSFREQWFLLHPPDSDGMYTCYLQTTPLCPKRMTRKETTLDHVIPKAGLKGRQLKYNDENLRPACYPCNGDKGSMLLEKYLEKKYKEC